MGRSILAVVGGMLTAVIAVFGIEMISRALYPPPEGLDTSDKAAIGDYIATLPVTAFLIIALAYAVAAFLGAYVAATLARQSKQKHGYIVGGLFLGITIVNLFSLPHPIWFWVLSILVIAGGVIGGVKIAMTPKKTA